MTNTSLLHRQKARLLEHELWIGQRSDGNWQVWIEGERHLELKAAFPNQDGAKRIVHSLAHRHLGGKLICDCTAELQWEQIHAAEQVPPEEKRTARRFNYTCEIQWQDEGVFSIGRIRNLSTGGAFIQTLNPPAEGSIINLRFMLGSFQVETLGRVVRQLQLQGMGVQFLDLSPAGREAIAGLLVNGG